MKFNTIWAVALMLVFALSASAQKDFQGTVVYGMEYIELPAQMEGMEAMLPKEMTMMIKGDRTRVDQALGMGMRQSSIIDTKNKTMVMLMDMMGQKMKVQMDLDEMEQKEKSKGKKSDVKIEYVDEQKTIAGFKCKKALVTSKGDENSIEVYYTEDLPSSASREFEGLKGFPLEFGKADAGMSIKITATQVDRSKVDDSNFDIPEGYQEMDPAMLEKIMGG